MAYLSSVSPQFSFQEQPVQPSKNNQRLQLRHSVSNKLIPKVGLPDNEEEQIILQKTRRRSSSASSKASSTHYISPFEEYESFGVFSEFTDDRSKPSTPVDDVLPDASPLRLGGSAASTMRKSGGKELRKASFYSEASTLVSDGFGDLMLLSSQSIVGPRLFYESGSGSENGSSKRERKLQNNIASNKRRPATRGRIGMGNHNIYTTPPRESVRDISDYPHLGMHPEDARKYIEHLEQQTEDLTTQLHNLTSPTSTSSNVVKLKRLTAENRALKDEIEEWETAFDDKVKEQCRSRIIANEMEARARVKSMEQTLEETRETVKILNADIDRLKVIIDEVAHERDLAEKEKREMELKVEALSDVLRAREGESRASSRCSGRAGRNNVHGRYSTGSFSGSVVAALRESGARPLSISSSQFDDSEGEANSRRGSDASLSAAEDLRILRLAHVGYTDAPSPRTMSPIGEPGPILPVKRVRSFKGGSSPQPLILPATTGISSPTSPITGGDSLPPFTHSASHPTSFYGAGIQANSSNTSIDSGRTPSVRSGIAPVGNSLFSELSMLDDMMSDATSHRDDASEYSRFHSRVPSYASFARHHHRGPSLITSPIVATPRVRSPTPAHSPLRPPVRSPILATTNESPIPTSTCHLPPTHPSVFSMLTCPPSRPFHIVADTLTRYRLGKLLIAVGHGLKSPRVTLYKVRNKAREVAVKVLTGDTGVENVPKKKRKVWSQRGTIWNDDRNCSRCSPYERGRKRLAKSPQRSVSAPISTQVSNPLLSSDTPTEGRSREPSVTRDQPTPMSPLQNHRRRRVSSASKVGGKTSPQQGPEQVRRQHRVHAGDNVWLWFRFLMAIMVTLGVTIKNDEKDNSQKIKSRYKNDTAITDDEDADSDCVSEYDKDILQIKMNKWRRSRISEVGR